MMQLKILDLPQNAYNHLFQESQHSQWTGDNQEVSILIKIWKKQV